MVLDDKNKNDKAPLGGQVVERHMGYCIEKMTSPNKPGSPPEEPPAAWDQMKLGNEM
jgi:hypothetical protein